MNSLRQVTARDLVEEGKKRVVILIVCVVGLSYIMSLTSSSVWVNLPAAASLIILLRYFSLDYEMRRKAATYNNKPSSTNTVSQNNTSENSRVAEKSDWKTKVKSPVVEDAIDHFTRHLVSEFVTDMWYSRLTPDQQGPEELVQIVNGVLGEISVRLRNINLFDLLMRDVINLVCTHLELFRASQVKIEKNLPGLLSIEQRDTELQRVLAAENRLHPALFSGVSEHKVLQHVMDGLISFTFRPEDLKCSVFRYIVRELLACAVMRPVLNLASPRFINERIEILVISKTQKGVATTEGVSQSKPNGSSKISSDQFTRILDPTATGVELVQLKVEQSKTVPPGTGNENGTHLSKDPLLSIDTRSSRSWSSLHLNPQSKDGGAQNHNSGEFGEMLDMLSRRKTAALTPENFDNMWAKGRNYKNKEGQNCSVKQVSQSCVNKPVTVDHSKTSRPVEKHVANKLGHVLHRNGQASGFHQATIENHLKNHSSDEDDEHGLMHVDDSESGSISPYTSEEEDRLDDPSSVTGLDDPGTKVWDRKTNRNPVSPIHHPLENRGRHGTKKTGRSQVHYERSAGAQSSRKRSRTSAKKGLVWQEIERTSFLSGDGQDILGSKRFAKPDISSDDSEDESLDRVYSGATASSSSLSVYIPQNDSSTSLKNSLMADSFFKLRCEVLGANIVKSASRTFAVYSISVTDVNSNSWSIKRRFRHFEELHRRLKEYPEYNLHLPPKHFLSTGSDMPVIQERCILLDRYLKNLLQFPRISGSIEVWDFLSVDSQTYVFSNSFSIVETLSVDLDNKPSEKGKMVSNFVGPAVNSSSDKTDQSGLEPKKSTSQTKHSNGADGARMNPNFISHSPSKKLGMQSGKSFEGSGSDSDTPRNRSSLTDLAKIMKASRAERVEKTAESFHDASTDPAVPTEWVPPNLTAPLLDLVDVIFQLQDGGWIRRKAFWVAKQILQLGMGDAFDDWLIEKIQLLRTGSVVASGIKRVEQILWPDGIFITKHPKRRQASVSNSPNGQQSVSISSPKGASPLGRQPAEISSPKLTDEQLQEADRRAKFVYELMIDNAPAAIVSVVGRKEYEQCAKDLYFFLQSSVSVKQLAFDLLELLLLSAFPEMDYIFRQLHEEKHRFGEFKPS
ncbi:Phox-associated domain Phox-like Sorting nexin C-terminal [Euphorbia peplus]|nr:Phox-associated domain Phox-like Sorting nexin C-terminal [Euphorbia peplus]